VVSVLLSRRDVRVNVDWCGSVADTSVESVGENSVKSVADDER
jgi:hypothetical protein